MLLIELFLFSSKSLKEIEKEQEKLCVENYKVAFRAFRDCFNDSDSTTKTWKTKYPALSSEDNEKVIETLYKNWNNMFPSRSLSSVADDLKFLSSIDPYILGTYQTQETGSFLIQNYQRALKALANLASAVDKPMIADIIHVYLNEREFHPENNESYTVMCWGEPAYAFHGGSLDEKKRKWMKFAVNVAHVPEKVSDQIILVRSTRCMVVIVPSFKFSLLIFRIEPSRQNRSTTFSFQSMCKFTNNKD